MLEKIIENIIFDIKEQKKSKEAQSEIIKKRIDEYNQEIKKLTEKLESINNEYSSLLPPDKPNKNKYNLFGRVFKNSYKKAIKEYLLKYDEYKKQKQALKESLDKIKIELKEVESKKNNDSKSLDILELELNEIEVRLENFNDKDNIIKYIIETNPNLCKEKEFMLELIQENILNIIYDKSNDINLYINFFQIILETIDISDYDRNIIMKIIDELKNPSPSVDGKYNIPIKYMFEIIRNNIIMEQTSHKKNNNINNIIGSLVSGCQRYMDLNNILPISYGEELQKLWEDDSVRIGVHGFGTFSVSESIFKKGLRCSQQFIGHLDLKYTSIVKNYNGLSFVTLLDYNTAIGSHYIVFALPESCFDSENKEPIWGSHNPTVCGEEYILPKYIIGVVRALPLNETRTDLDYSKKKFLHNECIEPEIYEYFFENGFDYNLDNKKRLSF